MFSVDELTNEQIIVNDIIKNIFKDYEINLNSIPIVNYSILKNSSYIISINSISLFRYDSIKFFYEIISRWLIFGSKVDVESLFTSKYENTYLVMKVVISINSQIDVSSIEANLLYLISEIKIGLNSVYHSKKILEMKNISSDETAAFIRDRLAYLVDRFPNIFDYDIFILMQKFLISTTDEFRKARVHLLSSRVIYTLYVMLKQLSDEVVKNPKKRYLSLRLIRSKVCTLFGEKDVLGFFVGLNFLKKGELFDKKHLKKGVSKYFSDISIVEDSYFVNCSNDGNLLTFYMEITKGDGKSFTFNEINLLKNKLRRELQGCVESLVRPVFMPRNEEEVMKYTVTLSNQIKLARDIPQIVIMFDGQIESELFFTVIIVRVILDNYTPINEIFDYDDDVIIEKVKKIGLTNKAYNKEASILKIHLYSTTFLRDDFSVDLYNARQAVLGKLKDRLGDVRDYNGGMIAKQMEVFLSFKEFLHIDNDIDNNILEIFFHSLYPIEQRCFIQLEYLKIFYMLFHKLLNDDIQKVYKKDDNALYLCMKANGRKEKKEILTAIRSLKIPTQQLIKLYMPINSNIFLGFIYFTDSKIDKDLFLQKL